MKFHQVPFRCTGQCDVGILTRLTERSSALERLLARLESVSRYILYCVCELRPDPTRHDTFMGLVAVILLFIPSVITQLSCYCHVCWSLYRRCR